MDDINQLLWEVNEKSKLVKSHIMSMSIGEIINLYKDWELIIRPEFQRLFRWNKEQKTNFIESIFLWIPTPSIFVSETQDRKRELIDGLQRISTILEFANELKKQNTPLIPWNSIQDGLLSWEYLSHLDGVIWSNLNDVLKIQFKRSRMDVNILSLESDPTAKYEIFNRLNTGGSFLTDQEIRNSILLQFNKNFFDFIHSLRQNSYFQIALNFSDSEKEKESDTEMILRFFAIKNYDQKNDGRIKSVSSFLSHKMKGFITKDGFCYEEEKNVFNQVFQALSIVLWENAFKRFSPDTTQFLGRTMLPWFDTIAAWLWYNVQNGLISLDRKDVIVEKIKNLRQNEDFNRWIWVWKSSEMKLAFCESFWKKFFSELSL